MEHEPLAAQDLRHAITAGRWLLLERTQAHRARLRRRAPGLTRHRPCDLAHRRLVAIDVLTPVPALHGLKFEFAGHLQKEPADMWGMPAGSPYAP